MEVKFSKSENKGKKMKAVFYKDNKKIKTTHFGATGYSDYTKHKDENRKKLYDSRHKKNENWNAFKSAGSLSKNILWNKETISASIKDYKKKFNLKWLKLI